MEEGFNGVFLHVMLIIALNSRRITFRFEILLWGYTV